MATNAPLIRLNGPLKYDCLALVIMVPFDLFADLYKAHLHWQKPR